MRTLALLLMLAATSIADDAVDRIATEALKAWQVPGVAVAVVKDGRTLAVTAAGLREIGKPDALTADDVFPLASCTKAFTATLMAQLADEGHLGWDDPVRKHLPEFHLSDPNADALVSLRDLLTHRTGVAGHDLLWYRTPWKSAEVLTRIGKMPLKEPFRGSYQYSTLMYMAAGQAAANAAKQSWDEAVRQRLIEPLGMKSVAFTTNTASKVSGHRFAKDGKLELCPRYEIAEPNPAGSLNSNIRDMVPWLQLQLDGGTFNGKRLVSAANLAVTHSPQIVIPVDAAMKRFLPDTVQLSYAMGWIVSDYRGLKVLAHGGMIDGFRSQVILVPERGLGIALFNNMHDSRMNQALGNSLIDHYLGLPSKDWNAIFLKAVADERAAKKAEWDKLRAAKKNAPARLLTLDRYAGEYTHPAYGTATLTVKDNALVWKWSSFAVPLEDWGDEIFRCTEGYLEDRFVGFRVNADGVEYLLFEGQKFQRK